jgi:hypothetical protein
MWKWYKCQIRTTSLSGEPISMLSKRGPAIAGMWAKGSGRNYKTNR